MAIFGDLGKAIGLGTAKETVQAGLQGALRGAIMGQPFMGGATAAASAGQRQNYQPGPSETGQSVAIDIAQAPPAESSMSGERGLSIAGGGIVPASYGGNVPLGNIRG